MNLPSLLLPPPPVEKRMQSSVNISRAGLDFGTHMHTSAARGFLALPHRCQISSPQPSTSHRWDLVSKLSSVLRLPNNPLQEVIISRTKNSVFESQPDLSSSCKGLWIYSQECNQREGQPGILSFPLYFRQRHQHQGSREGCPWRIKHAPRT